MNIFKTDLNQSKQGGGKNEVNVMFNNFRHRQMLWFVRAYDAT